jgi:hypothetical protein
MSSQSSSFQIIPNSGQNGKFAPQLLPSSSSGSEKGGLLEASILSVYDLPFSEPPIAVTLSACGITVTSGPPVSRHKDRNSFRFSSATPSADTSLNSSTSTTSSNSNPDVKLIAPLRALHNSKVAVRVIYANKSQLLETEYELGQLRIHESKWLIFNLATGDSHTLTGTTKNSEDEIPPTIRLKLCLSGPYRPEVASLVGLCQAWFGLVDYMEGNAQQALKVVPKLPMQYSKYLLIPAVPVVAALVVASPVVAAVVMVTLPFLLPLVLTVVTLAAGLLVTSGVVYSSTQHGREHVGGTLSPFVDSFVHSKAGQTLVYDTGPRPTPVSVSKQILPTEMWARLIVSLFIDLIGSSSYLLPFVGEGLDLAWAPIQTILIMAMYDPTTPNLKYVSFVEEILPFTDIVPTATIGWACEFVPHFIGKNPDISEMMNNLSPERTVAKPNQ